MTLVADNILSFYSWSLTLALLGIK